MSDLDRYEYFMTVDFGPTASRFNIHRSTYESFDPNIALFVPVDPVLFDRQHTRVYVNLSKCKQVIFEKCKVTPIDGQE